MRPTEPMIAFTDTKGVDRPLGEGARAARIKGAKPGFAQLGLNGARSFPFKPMRTSTGNGVFSRRVNLSGSTGIRHPGTNAPPAQTLAQLAAARCQPAPCQTAYGERGTS